MGGFEQLAGMLNDPPSPAAPATPPSQPPAPPAAAAPAKKQNPLKAFLTNFAQGAGDAMMKSAGLPTYSEKMLMGAQAEHLHAQSQLANTQAQQMATQVTLPNGLTVPYAIGLKMFPEMFKQGQINDRLDKTLNFKANEQDLRDHLAIGVNVDPKLAELAGMPELGGQKVTSKKQLDSLKAAIGLQGLKLVDDPASNSQFYVNNRGEKTGLPLGASKTYYSSVVRPTVQAQERAKWTPFQTVDGDTISNADALRTHAQGASNPLIRRGLLAFEPAYERDTRLKQMIQQSDDQTGASDMALLFNHIAMTGGNVKGMRVGELMTQEHMKARSIPEELGVLYNKAVQGQKLSPEQRENFVKLAIEVRNSQWQQSRNEARVYGVAGMPQPDADLPPIPETGIVGSGIEGLRAFQKQRAKAGSSGGNIPEYVRDPVTKKLVLKTR